jgi:hypothetical protein
MFTFSTATTTIDAPLPFQVTWRSLLRGDPPKGALQAGAVITGSEGAVMVPLKAARSAPPADETDMVSPPEKNSFCELGADDV